MPPSNARTEENAPRPPFDDEDADIIFRSSDNVEFRLYKVILAKASPVFRTMIQLPQPSSPGALPTLPPIVELTEDAKTLENLLRLCYPVEHPSVTSLDDVHNILETARKYEIASVAANLRWTVRCRLPKEPLRIYAIAYLWQMKDVAEEAANLLLDMPQFHIPPLAPPEFSVLPSLAIYAVHKYRQNCATAALQALSNEDWASQASWIWMTCTYGHPSTTIISGSRRVTVRQWFEVYLNALKTALDECPSGRTIRAFLASSGTSEALSKTAPCQNCASKAYTDLARFSESLAVKVDGAIAQVSNACASSLYRQLKAGRRGPIWVVRSR